jgi:DNA mismatch repair ATPase MutL
MQACSKPALIKRLPEAAVQQSRASTQITDLTAAVCELVRNAIEAEAHCVQVSVSTRDWSASVADDGCGISSASMQLVGNRCCSSKPPPAHGEALSCLVQVANLTITSRAKGGFETYSKSLSSSSTTAVQLCSGPRQRHGTTVSLTNFLQGQPVRRRQLSSKGHAAALEEVKAALHALLLPHLGVELTLQQPGSSAPVLRMPKVTRQQHAVTVHTVHADDAAVSPQDVCT